MKYDPNIVYHSETPAFIRGVRLVFGGVFGLLPGLWLLAHLYPIGVVGVVVILTMSMTACAALAACFGDQFWHRVAQFLRSNLFF